MPKTSEPDAHTAPQALTGLTQAEVAERVAAGRVNANADVKTKSVSQIVREHALTLFNMVNLGMAVLVMITGQYRNMMFMGVVFSNLAIGIVQELRAKRMVDRLTIITASDVRVIREGKECSIPVDQVVVDDLVVVSHGDQVPADGVVVAGAASMNESLLTGESDAIPKVIDDEVLSGSFVDSGSLTFRATNVGIESYASRINDEAKFVKAITSEIRDTLNWIIKMATITLIPVGIALFLRSFLSDSMSANDAILTTVAAIVGMIPQGLVLLTSSVFAIATTRLGMRQVLVQQAYCVETLARVDVLCLDKTGTITTGSMELADIRAGRGVDERDVAVAAFTVASANEADANETARAILAYGQKEGLEPKAISRAVPFSSATKLSGCVTTEGRTYLLGAPQFVLGPLYTEHEWQIRAFDRLERVLVVAEADGFTDAGVPMGRPRVIGFLGIRDEIRDTAAQTMAYFVEQGVDIRVISGDDPMTVSAIAEKVGVPDAGKWVDATFLESMEEIEAAVQSRRVFGRVTPTIKRELVRCLRAEGHTVAMTGDGVNDILALKEANCSVAMASGSAAARNVADIVLADSDFSHMPEVVAEGRRSINNLQRSASLFLMKTVYSALLAIVCVVMPPFPLLPIQMTLVSTAIIGIPSFALALEPNRELVRGRFLTNVLARSMPASIAIAVGMFVMLLVERGLGGTFAEVSTCCMLLTAAVGIMLIYRIAQPLNPLRTALLVFCVAYVVGGCTLFTDFFGVVALEASHALSCAVIVIAAVIGFNALYNYSTTKAHDFWDALRAPDKRA